MASLDKTYTPRGKLSFFLGWRSVSAFLLWLAAWRR